MSAANHTPGPWHLGGEHGAAQLRPRISILRNVTYVEGASPTTYVIGEVGYPTTTGNTVGAAERVANAHLIAAAPELLEALQALMNAKDEADDLAAHNRAMAAIAKATGEQQ